MHSIVIIDFETTGIDPATERAGELGAILYSLRDRTVVEQFATIIRGEGNAAESINRIPPSALLSAPDVLHALARLTDLANAAEDYGTPVFMAHRAEFDRGFLAAIEPRLAERAPWVCSKFDVAWPLSKPGASCVEMALAHGVGVTSAHRALTDCTLIAKTIEAAQAIVDVDALIVRALRPKATFAALVSFDDREKAKAAGFRWDAPTKRWLRAMAIEDAEQLPFAVREVAA